MPSAWQHAPLTNFALIMACVFPQCCDGTNFVLCRRKRTNAKCARHDARRRRALNGKRVFTKASSPVMSSTKLRQYSPKTTSALNCCRNVITLWRATGKSVTCFCVNFAIIRRNLTMAVTFCASSVPSANASAISASEKPISDNSPRSNSRPKRKSAICVAARSAFSAIRSLFPTWLSSHPATVGREGVPPHK